MLWFREAGVKGEGRGGEERGVGFSPYFVVMHHDSSW